MKNWVPDASAKASECRADIARLERAGLADAEQLASLKESLEEAKKQFPGRNKLASGNRELAWELLHNIEKDIDDLDTSLSRVHTRAMINAQYSLSPARIRTFNAAVEKANSDQAKLELSRALSREAHAADGDKHSSERNNRRGLFFGGLTLVIFAVCLLAYQAAQPTHEILPRPAAESSPSGFALLLIVMGFGAMGGLLGGLFRMYIRPTRLTNTRWFDIKPVLLFFNAAFGIWTAVIGVGAVGTELIVGKYPSLTAAVLLATVFGYGQRAVTKYLEQKAAELVVHRPAGT